MFTIDVWRGLDVTDPNLTNPPSLQPSPSHPSEHVTITVVIYNTCAGGVPTAADVCAAVDDMEGLYASCMAQGKLSSTTFNFMKVGQLVS